jgi:hypothetical protein
VRVWREHAFIAVEAGCVESETDWEEPRRGGSVADGAVLRGAARE